MNRPFCSSEHGKDDPPISIGMRDPFPLKAGPFLLETEVFSDFYLSLKGPSAARELLGLRLTSSTEGFQATGLCVLPAGRFCLFSLYIYVQLHL